jgi:hypothetical protein
MFIILSLEGVTVDGVGLDIWLIDHFNTQFVITFNYNAILISTLYKSLEHTLSLFQSSVSSLDDSW